MIMSESKFKAEPGMLYTEGNWAVDGTAHVMCCPWRGMESITGRGEESLPET